ncbi:MAG: ABC-three component system middle component 6 [Acholeplasmataceae bacterium]|jgi:hypothetical protein
MLLPDNIRPELCVYYNGAIVLSELNKNPSQNILDLYSRIVERHDMTFSMYILSLDWLYIIDFAKIDEEGVVRKCL